MSRAGPQAGWREPETEARQRGRTPAAGPCGAHLGSQAPCRRHSPLEALSLAVERCLPGGAPRGSGDAVAFMEPVCREGAAPTGSWKPACWVQRRTGHLHLQERRLRLALSTERKPRSWQRPEGACPRFDLQDASGSFPRSAASSRRPQTRARPVPWAPREFIDRTGQKTEL